MREAAAGSEKAKAGKTAFDAASFGEEFRLISATLA
jgi:hypothetical protein